LFLSLTNDLPVRPKCSLRRRKSLVNMNLEHLQPF